MAVFHCPGQDRRFWKPGDIFDAPCPHCGAAIEFWKDEARYKCKGCGETVMNPKLDLGCAKWCKYAKECLGVDVLHGADATLSQQLIEEMSRVFGDDERRIQHALHVLKYAETILEAEGGDPLIVRAAAILHDIGIHEAEKKHGSAAGKYQEIEGPPIARNILQELGVDKARIESICDIIAHHHTADAVDTLEFKIIWDADHIVNLSEECAGKDPARLRQLIENRFRTQAGRTLAGARFLAARRPPETNHTAQE